MILATKLGLVHRVRGYLGQPKTHDTSVSLLFYPILTLYKKWRKINFKIIHFNKWISNINIKINIYYILIICENLYFV